MTSCLCRGSNQAHADEVKKSRKIDKELKKSAKIYQATIKLLLLGAGESGIHLFGASENVFSVFALLLDEGKSTVVKQMKIIHTSKYTNEERRSQIPDIKSNIKDTIISILVAMERLEISLESEKLRSMRENMLERLSETNEFIHKTEFWDMIEKLWQDEGVKRCALMYGNQFNILDSAQYFLDRIPIIRQENYLPDDQDILRCRVLTTGILETKFKIKDVHFHIFDVGESIFFTRTRKTCTMNKTHFLFQGGQREERRKWIQCFNEVTAIIFVVDISAYNMTLREDTKVNRLRESLNLFRSIWVNRWLSRVSIILFLNKYDLFTQKIESGKCKLEKYFPEFKKYQLPRSLDKSFKVDHEHIDVTRAKMFILELFINITNEDLNNALSILSNGTFDANHPKSPTIVKSISTNELDQFDPLTDQNRQLINRDVFYKMENNYMSESSQKFCMPYFTCAVDTENIKRVFKACNDILQKEHMEKSGLI
jgi:guanine nucleotide-binding protein G(s) subunit alpha